MTAYILVRARRLDLEGDAAHRAVCALPERRAGLYDDIGRPADDALPSTPGAAGKAPVYWFPERRRSF